MNPLASLEQGLWDKHSSLIETEQLKFEASLRDLKSDDADIERRKELLIGAFSSISTHLLSASKVIWLMTGRNDGRKAEVRSDLETRFTSAEERLLMSAESSLDAVAGQKLRVIAEPILQQIRAGILSEFLNLGDPLAQRDPRPTESPKPSGYNPRLSVLFMSAEPSRTEDGQRPSDALNLDIEFREIQRAIEVGRFREQIDLKPVLATTTQEFLDALNRHRPQIVHFSGHGSPTDGIVLIDEEGRPARVGAEFLASVFTTLAADIRLVVLNACFSADQADAISHSIPVTVGTPRQISDKACVKFSRTFYSALANGLSVDQAFWQADAILLAIDRNHRPTLLSRDHVKTATMRLVRSPFDDDFAPLALALSSSTKEFLSQRGPLRDFLSKVAGSSLTRVDLANTRVEESQLAGITRLRRSITEETEKAKSYTDSLDGISRRWSKHLGDSAVGKLTRLEQAVDTYVRELQKYSRVVFQVIDRLVDQSRVGDDWSGESASIMESLVPALEGLRSFLNTSDQSIKLYYNQLLELLPGDPGKSFLFRP